jgi:AcrR family transcriptional regulator
MLRFVVGREGLREQKKRRARDALERAALKLFEERGFDAATIKEIAEAAGMSPRTFFRYFGSKEDVVFVRQADDFAILKDLLAQVPNDGRSSFAAMKAAVSSFADYYQNQPPEEIKLRAKLLAESLPLRRRVAHEIQAWGDDLAHDLAAREGEPIQPRHFLIAGISLHVMQVAGTAWGMGDQQLSFTKILDQMFNQLEIALLQERDSATRY